MFDILKPNVVKKQDEEASGPLGVIIAASSDEFRPFMALGPGQASGVQVLSTTRDIGDLTDDLQKFKPQLVVVSVEARGYSPGVVKQLAEWPDYPLAVVGLVPPTGTYGAEMTGQGAVGIYTTPITPAIVDKFAKETPGWVEQARTKWNKPVLDSGVSRKVIESLGAQSYKTGVVTFWSAKGGDGKTVLAVNTACLLALVAGKRVLLIDNDMNCGRVWLHLNVVPGQNTLLHLASDFMAHGNQLDNKMLKRRVMGVDRELDPRTKVVEARLDVLFGITDIEQASADELRGKQGQQFMSSLMDLARRMYDFVIVDMGSSTQIGAHAGALMAADIVIFINPSDRTSLIPNQKTLKTVLAQTGLPADRFRLVVNKYDERDRVNLKNVADLMGMQVSAVVPDDTSREMIVALNEGRPFVVTHMGKNNDAAEQTLHGILKIAEEIYPPMGKVIAERDQKHARGLFGLGRK